MTNIEYELSASEQKYYGTQKLTSIKSDTGKVGNIALCYPKYSKLDGSYVNYTEPCTAFISNKVSDVLGEFVGDNPKLKAVFNSRKSCYGVQIRFNATSDDRPKKVKISYYTDTDSTNLLQESTYEVNSTTLVAAGDVLGFRVVEVEFIGTSKPYRPIFVEHFDFLSCRAYDGLKIVYDGRAPHSIENSSFDSIGNSEFGNIDWIKTGEVNNVALMMNNYSMLEESIQNYEGQKMAAYVSQEISDDEGNFSSSLCIRGMLSDGLYISNGIRLKFDPNGRDYLSEVEIIWFRQGAEIDRMTFHPDNNDYTCHNIVYYFDEVIVNLIKSAKPNRRAIVSLLEFGEVVTFESSQISSDTVDMDVSLIASELSTNTLDFTLKYADYPEIFQKTQQVKIYFDDKLQGAFYITDHNQTSPIHYDVSAQDLTSLLDATYYGAKFENVYKAEYNDTIENVVAQILNGTGLSFNIEERLRGTIIKGTLPIMSRRDALKQIAFASNAIVDMFGTDILTFKYKYGAPEPKTLTFEQMMKVSVKHLDIASKVEVSTQNYMRGDEVVLFEGELVDTSTITFPSASIITSINGSTVDDAELPSYSINAVVVTPSEPGNVIIKGYQLTEINVLVEYYNPTVSESDRELNVVTLDKAYFVGPHNQQDVVERVMDYYTRDKEVTLTVYDMTLYHGDYLTIPLYDGTTYTGQIFSLNTSYSTKLFTEVKIR